VEEIMDAATRTHFYSAIERAGVVEEPFPHLYATNVFPADFYQRLVATLPALDEYKRYSDRYAARYSLDLTADSVKNLKDVSAFWIEFERWLNSTELLNALFSKFGDRMKSCYALRKRLLQEATTADGIIVSSQSLLCRDFANFAIDPHTDAPPKLVVGIFYFPKDDSLIEFGTSLYRPKDPTLRSFPSNPTPRDKFELVKTFENRPNSFAAFLKTDNSFHGVESRPHSNIGRDVLFWIPRIGSIPRTARVGLEQKAEARESFNVVAASMLVPDKELVS
jgi:hypothetical protein